MWKTIRPLLLLPLTVAWGCSDDKDPVGPPERNIVEVVQAQNAQTGEFSVLLAAVTAAGLVEALSGDDELTVFGPTDAAFAELGLDATSVTTLPVEDLRNILLYHVVSGRYAAAQVLQRTSLTALNGGELAVRLQGSTAFVNDSRIVQVDVGASNGVIHVIDAVLLPG